MLGAAIEGQGYSLIQQVARVIRISFAYEGILDGVNVAARTWYDLGVGAGELLTGDIADNGDGTASLAVEVPAAEAKAFFRLETIP